MLPFVTSIAGNFILWFWLASAIVLWVATRGHPRPRRLALGAWILVWILACRPVAERMLQPLEGRYPPMTVAELEIRGISQVVVLTGGGFAARADLLSDALPPAERGLDN